jgi:hypothetical protein
VHVSRSYREGLVYINTLPCKNTHCVHIYCMAYLTERLLTAGDADVAFLTAVGTSEYCFGVQAFVRSVL